MSWKKGHKDDTMCLVFEQLQDIGILDNQQITNLQYFVEPDVYELPTLTGSACDTDIANSEPCLLIKSLSDRKLWKSFNRKCFF